MRFFVCHQQIISVNSSINLHTNSLPYVHSKKKIKIEYPLNYLFEAIRRLDFFSLCESWTSLSTESISMGLKS